MSAVVVTGAAGFLGQRVLADLVRHGAEVVAVDLVPQWDNHLPVRSHIVDLAADPADRLVAALEGADSVIHLAWSHHDPGSGSPLVASGRGDRPAENPPAPSNVVSVRRVLEAADRAGVSRLVHLSSATVYGAWADNPIPLTEDAIMRPNPGFAFAVEKAEAEHLVADWAARHPAATVTVLRPTVTVGSAGPALYQALAGTGGPQPGDSGRPMQFLHVDDLASAVVFAWQHGLRGVYNVAPDGWIAEEDARKLAGGVARLPLPGRMARALAAIGWQVLRTGIPKEALAYSVHPWVVANDRVRAAGWVPEHSNEEALVSSNGRNRWRDLPPSRRQQLMLAGAVAGVAGLAAGAAATVASMVSRARRPN